VPDDLYAALVQRAKERDTSISAEAIRLLRRALAFDRTGVSELLDEIESARPKLKGRPPSAAALVRRDRDAR